MEKAAFDKLRGHEFNNGLKLRHVASFAIWNKDKPTDSSEVERSVGKLKGQYVFVALNFGGTQNLPEDPEKLKELDWKNFHYTFHPNGGDSRIRRVLEDSGFEGAYITDIVKNYATPQAGNVNWIDYVKQHPEHIEWFIEEINLLSADTIKMYLFGKDVENIFIKNKSALYPALGRKVKLCQRIEHFSPSATNFLQWAPVQLGLKGNDVGAKIHPPVWKK